MNQSEFADPGSMRPAAWMSGSPTRRIPKRRTTDELRSLMIDYGHNPYFFEVKDNGDTADAHRRFAILLDTTLERLERLRRREAERLASAEL